MCEVKKILAGYGKMDVTPFAPVHLGSFNNGMERLSNCQKENDPFNAICLALTDENDETMLFCVTDLSWGHIDWARKLREFVWERYGIPGDHVVLGGTHNHSGPDWYSEASETLANKAYLEHWFNGLTSAIYIALMDRKPAEIQIGRTKTSGLNFVRRYWREDGNLIGGGPGKYYVQSDSPIVRHESDVDEEVQMVRFVREEGKDILVSQWQNHGCHIGGTRLCATDWIGPMRRKIERELGCHVFYMQGCAGNIQTGSRIKEEYPKKMTEDQIGYAVADTIIAAYRKRGTFTPVEAGPIKTVQQTFHGISVDDDPWEGEMNTISIGDISAVTFPVEMFDTSGKELKAATPYKMTLLMGYSCGIHGYAPDKTSFANGGYETTSRGRSGTAEQIIQTHLDALNKLHD